MALNWGIIGTGNICVEFIKALQYLPDKEHQVKAVAGIEKEQAGNLALKYGIPIAYESCEDLVKDESIDVIYVGSLSAEHYSMCKLVLTNKKHLLCEKPSCFKFRETEELIRMAKQYAVFYMEAVWSRCFPVYDELLRLLSSNSIGKLIYLKADFGVPIGYLDPLTGKITAGGTLFDLGVYTLQFAMLVFGKKPCSMVATAHVNENGVDESINYIIKYDDGKTANMCTHSRIQMENSAVVYGSDGHIKIKDPFWAPTVISVNDGEEKIFPLPTIPGETCMTHSEGLVYEAMEVRDCIMKGLLESSKMTHDDTLTIAEWQDKICKMNKIKPCY
ncbi:trans-1,2-dihydrobenzene-1,2-diol dehydrogenase-like [Halyomorpha halys]|uniref:trans-1,2-dihydrobenzene-1,2-diol dehydrogenase-like n=1 Tax=Halyomorpha halys TaxID=286706 RepID=UPI0006D50B4E